MTRQSTQRTAVAGSTPNAITSLLPEVEHLIVVVRGHRVMLDATLAGLYRVETRALVQAVHRNAERFPADFMFQLTPEEFASLTSQFVTSNSRGGRRHLPYAFTEQGVAMLSGVLRGEQAVRVNLEIMRAFVRLRQLLAGNADLARRLDELEDQYDSQFGAVFDAIRQLMAPPAVERQPLGFRPRRDR